MRPVRISPCAFRRRSCQPQDRPEAQNPIADRVRPAGSFLGDFRTPAGARNSSRERNGCFGDRYRRKLPFAHSRATNLYCSASPVRIRPECAENRHCLIAREQTASCDPTQAAPPPIGEAISRARGPALTVGSESRSTAGLSRTAEPELWHRGQSAQSTHVPQHRGRRSRVSSGFRRSCKEIWRSDQLIVCVRSH
jgi:hypothetical protein